ncbi:hypothetical protein BDF19DRAFT_143209 [Syncephalis fuscata]|nr:hypothetical protein BDF19DRAFT_143209 [Syncephalis fuscata]
MQQHKYAGHSSAHHRQQQHDNRRTSFGKRPALRSSDNHNNGAPSKQKAPPDVIMLKSKTVLCFCGLPASRTESPDIGGVYDCHHMNRLTSPSSRPSPTAVGTKLQKGIQANRRVREAETAKAILGDSGSGDDNIELGQIVPEINGKDPLTKLQFNWLSHPDRKSALMPDIHWRAMLYALKQHWEKTIDPPICCFHVHEDAWQEICAQENAWFEYTSRMQRPGNSNEPPPVRPSEIYPRPAYENLELMMCPWFNTTFRIAFRSFNQGPYQFMQTPKCYCGDPVVDEREIPGSPSGRRYRFICRHAKDGQPNRCAWVLWAEHVPFEQPLHLRHPTCSVDSSSNNAQILNRRRSLTQLVSTNLIIIN